MMPLFETYWPLLLIALVTGLAVAWFLFRANRRTKVTLDRGDVLDDGAAPAARNQALIDAKRKVDPPAAQALASPTGGDDLTRIKGLGPKIAVALAELGITSFEQIAAWDDVEIERIDGQLGRFEGRIRRDQWVEQASLLAKGDSAGFDARFGNQ